MKMRIKVFLNVLGFNIFACFTILGTEALFSNITYEVYKRTSWSNRSVACGVCHARGGHLPRHPELFDWELRFSNLSITNMEFWVDLVNVNNKWIWGNGDPFVNDSILRLALPPTNDSCVLWNPLEPFLKNVSCSSIADIMCAIPNASVCNFTKKKNLTITNSTQNLTSYNNMNESRCFAECIRDDNCWAADYNSSGVCRILNVTTSPFPFDFAPANDSNSTIRICHTFLEMSPDDSNFACNCLTIEIPDTEAGKKKFVEEYKAEMQQKLIVPKDTLSSTVRKKVSAPDERKSSQSLGLLGVVFITIVLGGIIALDFPTLVGHIKMVSENLMKTFGKKEGLTHNN